MNILITGCNGQLGNEMQLLEKENKQHNWFNTDVKELDITNQQAIEKFVMDNQIDGIVNCAAFTAVDKAESNVPLYRAQYRRTCLSCFQPLKKKRMADTDFNRLCI